MTLALDPNPLQENLAELGRLLKSTCEHLDELPPEQQAGFEGIIRDAAERISQQSKGSFAGRVGGPRTRRVHTWNAETAINLRDGAMDLDREWKVRYVHYRSDRQNGMGAENLIGKNLWEAVPNLAGTPLASACREAMENREPVHVEIEGENHGAAYLLYIFPTDEGITLSGVDPSAGKRDQAEREELLSQVTRHQTLLDNIFEADPGGLAVVSGEELRFAYANPTYRFIYPEAAGDLIGQRFEQVWPARDGASVGKYLKQVLNSGQPFQIRNLERHFPDGTTRYFTFQARRIEWGGERAVLLILWDTTEVSLFNRALRASEEKFRITIASIGDAVITTDAQGKITFLNPVAESLTGWGDREARGLLVEQVFSIINERTRVSVSNPVERVIRDGVIVGLANHTALISRDGREIPIEDSAAPIRSSGGEILGIVMVFHDVTEKRKAETALRESENKFMAIFQNAPMAIALSKLPNGVLVDINQAFTEMFGYTREEALGRTTFELGIAPDEHGREQILKQINQHGFARQVELAYRDLHGNAIFISGNIDTVAIGDEKYVLSTFDNITERKQAEEQAAYRAKLLARVQDAVVATDEETRIVFWNQAAEEMFGWTEAEAIGKIVPELLQTQLLEGTREERLRALVETGYFDGEVIYRRKDGSTITTHARTATVTGPHQGPGGFVTSIRDITERKQAERALQKSRLETQEILESIQDGFMEMDRDWQFTYVNRRAAQNVGYRPEELIGKNIWETFSALVGSEQEAFYRKVMDERQPGVMEIKGRITQQAYALRAYPSSNGITLFWVDISEQKEMEDALRESEERYRTLLSSIGDAVITTDREGRITYLNPVAEQLIGWPVKEAKGQPLTIVFPIVNEETRQPMQDPVEAVLQTGEVVALSNHAALLTRDGREIPIEDSAAPILDSAGGILGVVMVFHDVTAKRRTEENLRQLNRQIELSYEPILSWELDGGIISWNQGCEHLYGYSREEAIGRSSHELLKTRHPVPWATLKDELLEKGSWTGDLIHQTKDGREVSIESRHQMIQIGGRRFVLETNRDVTQRKLDEKAIQESQAQNAFLASVIELSSQPFAVGYLDGQLGLFNHAFEELTGYSAAELRSLNWAGTLTPPEWAKTEKEYLEVLQRTGVPVRYEKEYIRKDGRRTPIELLVHLVRDGDGSPRYYYSFLTDFSERKQAQERLRASQVWRDMTAEAAEVGAWDWDLENQKLVWDERHRALFGLPAKQEVSYADFIAAVHAEDRQKVEAEIWRARQTRTAIDMEYRNVWPDGSVHWIHARGRFLYSPEGKPIRQLGVVLDVTRLKQVEMNVRAQQARIEVQQRLLEQREEERLMIARDLHDGPVQELLAAIYALQPLHAESTDAQTAEEIKRVQDILHQQVVELRSYAGELRPPALAKFGLAKAIRSYSDVFQEKHPELHIQMEEIQSGDLIPDGKRLGFFRIYQEALNNIAKHAHASQIRVRLTKDERWAALEIQDDGIGFTVPEDWLELARHGHLGLVGMRERAEAIGGSLEIRSQVGSGTKIAVRVKMS
jgi:PAS domain S-box-containing protein